MPETAQAPPSHGIRFHLNPPGATTGASKPNSPLSRFDQVRLKPEGIPNVHEKLLPIKSNR
jgi:hypothetical protein